MCILTLWGRIVSCPTALCNLFCLTILFSFACMAAPPAQPLAGFPFQDETLRFSIHWPTGVGLGEGRMQAHRLEGGRWQFELSLDAGFHPGKGIRPEAEREG